MSSDNMKRRYNRQAHQLTLKLVQPCGCTTQSELAVHVLNYKQNGRVLEKLNDVINKIQ